MAPNARANKAAEKAKLANKQKVASPSLTVIMIGTYGRGVAHGQGQLYLPLLKAR